MAEVNDYTTGKVLVDIKQTFKVLESVGGSLSGSKIGERMLEEATKFEPRVIDIDGASQLIQESNKCAAGERVCRALFKDSPLTETVFLDELAEGMEKAGKAKYVTKDEAITILKKYPKNPIILSRVSGKYMEICRSWPENCVYWNLEEHGLKCLHRMVQGV